MVGHSNSLPGKVKIYFQPVDHPVDRRRKITLLGNTKVDISVFFLLTSGYFSTSNFLSCLLHKLDIVGKLEGTRPALRRAFEWLGQILSIPSEWMEGFREVSLARRCSNTEGIMRKVTGVRIISFPTYFNCCPFFLKILDCKSPSGDQLIFMSWNVKFSFVTI